MGVKQKGRAASQAGKLQQELTGRDGQGLTTKQWNRGHRSLSTLGSSMFQVSSAASAPGLGSSLGGGSG